MKTDGCRSVAVMLALAAVPIPSAGADSSESDAAWVRSVESAGLEYVRRLDEATGELTATRERIAIERLPLEERKRALQDDIIAIESALKRGRIEREHAKIRKEQIQSELSALTDSFAYITSLARDAVHGFKEGQLPGEAALHGERLEELHRRLQDSANLQNAGLALDAADFLTVAIEDALGGHTARGASLIGDSNELVEGTFAWIGPEVFFLTDETGVVATVRAREGVASAVAYPLPVDDPGAAAGVFRGEMGWVPLDPSGGKALRLQEVRGTWDEHIRRGGVIGYVILAMGGLAVLTTLMKLFDIRLMKIDAPEAIDRVLEVVRTGAEVELETAIKTLRPTSRELFAVGLRHIGQPKAVLEDHLYAALLSLRMRVERRLPFLTVIVSAAPLLGLLGTVTGMIKTFTLINVFGTGNAAKLSSGISEALVTTELGLMVAIPTLVAHGYLNRRAQKNLSELERYAAEFVAVTGERTKQRNPAPAPTDE